MNQRKKKTRDKGESCGRTGTSRTRRRTSTRRRTRSPAARPSCSIVYRCSPPRSAPRLSAEIKPGGKGVNRGIVRASVNRRDLLRSRPHSSASIVAGSERLPWRRRPSIQRRLNSANAENSWTYPHEITRHSSSSLSPRNRAVLCAVRQRHVARREAKRIIGPGLRSR